MTTDGDTTTRRWFVHADVDSMFAQVEQLDDPRLVGRPVLVGGTGRRAVVAAASKEAKRAGVRSAMPMGMAVRMLPGHVTVAPRPERYREVSGVVMRSFEPFADGGLVEQVSIDEAYLAVVATDPVAAGTAVVEAARAASGLTVSVGVGSTKLAAKLLSTWTKSEHGPGTVGHKDGDELLAWLGSLGVRALPGCGPVATETLAKIGVVTVADLREAQPALLRRAVGEAASAWLVAAADNRDERDVEPPSERKQVSQERTFAEDLDGLEAIADVAERMARDVAGSLARKGRFARTATVKVRTDEFEDVSRSRTLASPTGDEERFVAMARELTDVAWAAAGRRPVRLVGVSASNLADVAQESLW